MEKFVSVQTSYINKSVELLSPVKSNSINAFRRILKLFLKQFGSAHCQRPSDLQMGIISVLFIFI